MTPGERPEARVVAERGEARPEARRGEARQLWAYLGRGRQAAAGRRMIAQRACAMANVRASEECVWRAPRIYIA